MVSALAGAGLVAVAGTRLGRACGAGSMTARACIDAAGLPHPAWLAAGLTALCLVMFMVHKAQSRGWAAAPRRHAAGVAEDLSDDAAGTLRVVEPRQLRRSGRIPGRLVVRPGARGQDTVAEYSVATAMPDRVAFGRWLDQPLRKRGWRKAVAPSC